MARPCARRGERIDYYCWDLYARVSQWYDAGRRRREEGAETGSGWIRCTRSKQGGNEAAQIAELVSTAVLRRHLETMQRLDIEYDFLPRESEILHLHFWDSGL